MKEKIKLVIVFILGIMISVVISVYAATVISAGEVSYTDNKGIGASNVQDAINGVYSSANTLATNVNNLKELGVAYNNISSSSITMRSCTGSIANNSLKYRIVGNTLILTGKLVINVTSRTGAGPGVNITIPDSRKGKYNINVTIGYNSYKDALRYGESTLLIGDANSNTISIAASETFANVSNNKALVFIVPMTFVVLN